LWEVYEETTYTALEGGNFGEIVFKILPVSGEEMLEDAVEDKEENCIAMCTLSLQALLSSRFHTPSTIWVDLRDPSSKFIVCSLMLVAHSNIQADNDPVPRNDIDGMLCCSVLQRTFHYISPVVHLLDTYNTLVEWKYPLFSLSFLACASVVLISQMVPLLVCLYLCFVLLKGLYRAIITQYSFLRASSASDPTVVTPTAANAVAVSNLAHQTLLSKEETYELIFRSILPGVNSGFAYLEYVISWRNRELSSKWLSALVVLAILLALVHLRFLLLIALWAVVAGKPAWQQRLEQGTSLRIVLRDGVSHTLAGFMGVLRAALQWKSKPPSKGKLKVA
jgi:hypothetical protein